MRVRHGWSGQTKRDVWAKFDVELEEDDLRRILAEADIAPSSHTGMFASTMAVSECFQLLENEAERLVIAKLTHRYGFPHDEAAAKLAALAQEKNKIISRLRGLAEAARQRAEEYNRGMVVALNADSNLSTEVSA